MCCGRQAAHCRAYLAHLFHTNFGTVSGAAAALMSEDFHLRPRLLSSTTVSTIRSTINSSKYVEKSGKNVTRNSFRPKSSGKVLLLYAVIH